MSTAEAFFADHQHRTKPSLRSALNIALNKNPSRLKHGPTLSDKIISQRGGVMQLIPARYSEDASRPQQWVACSSALQSAESSFFGSGACVNNAAAWLKHCSKGHFSQRGSFRKEAVFTQTWLSQRGSFRKDVAFTKRQLSQRGNFYKNVVITKRQFSQRRSYHKEAIFTKTWCLQRGSFPKRRGFHKDVVITKRQFLQRRSYHKEAVFTKT